MKGRESISSWKAENYNPQIGLAEIYREQGKDTQAEALYQQVLRLCEQQLGPEHPDMATPLHGLALLYSRQETIQNRVLAEMMSCERRPAVGILPDWKENERRGRK